VLLSVSRLFWQLFVLFACCSGVGLVIRLLISKGFSLLNKFLFSLMSGLFLVVLIPQNLVYLGVPVRISGWLILALALVQVWLCRRKFGAWIHACYSNADLRTLAVVIPLVVPSDILRLTQNNSIVFISRNYDQYCISYYFLLLRSFWNPFIAFVCCSGVGLPKRTIAIGEGGALGITISPSRYG
jgi:hypothetical protein